MTNLLYKASIVTTPTAYGVGVLNSIKPAQGAADFQFDRNSTGTRVNEDYLIEDVPYNFVINSEEFSSSNYTKSGVSVVSNDIIAPNGTLTADKIVEDTSNGAHQIFDAVTTNSGNFTNSIMVKASGRTKIRLNSGSNSHRVDFDLSTATKSNEVGATGSIFSVSDGWYRCIVSWNNTTPAAQYLFIALLDNSGNTSYTGDGSSGVYIWGGQLVKGDQPKDYLKTTDRLDIPRLDYTNGTASILLESQSTNLVTYSEDFSDSSWTKTNATITSDSITSPEGIVNADKINISSDSQSGIRLFTQINNQEYNISAFVKKGSLSIVQFYTIQQGISSDTFDINLDTGTLGAIPSVLTNAKIENYGNDWYRVSCNRTFTASAANHGIGIVTDNGNGGNYYVWGFQLEEQSYATSYIPTTSGSAVTRAAETLNNAANSDLINSTEGVLYCEIQATANDGTYSLLSINNGTNSNAITIGKNTDSTFFIGVRVGGSYQTILTGVGNTNVFNKAAIKYKENDFKIYLNGSLVQSDTSGSVPSGLDRVSFDFGGALPFYGRCKTVAVFKEALSDTELACLTSTNNREIFLNYYYRMQYVGANTEALNCAQQTFNV